MYLVKFDKDRCKKRYIGESKRSLKYRLADHRGYLLNQYIDKVTMAHFNTIAHSLSNLKITILEEAKKTDTEFRKKREKYF